MNMVSVVRKHDAAALTHRVDAALEAAMLATDFDTNSGIYAIPGMSGKRYRAFINRLIGSLDDARYLEIGSWMGSTLCAAIHGNRVRAVAIDNWSEFGGPKDACLQHVMAFRPETAEVLILEADFRAVDYTRMNSYNVYLFDGPHGERDHFDGLSLPLPCLDARFVLIVDDWNWERVRDGTRAAIAGNGLRIEYAAEIRTTLDGNVAPQGGKDSDWHNGYFIAVLAKPS